MEKSTVKDWMSHLVVFVDPDTTVYEALHIMRHRYATSLIVEKPQTILNSGLLPPLISLTRSLPRARSHENESQRHHGNPAYYGFRSHVDHRMRRQDERAPHSPSAGRG